MASAADLSDLQGASPVSSPLDNMPPQSDDHEELSPEQRKVYRSFDGEVVCLPKGPSTQCFLARGLSRNWRGPKRRRWILAPRLYTGFATGADAAALRSRRSGQGLRQLGAWGSEDYTAAVELWAHPSRVSDNAPFEADFECWFRVHVRTTIRGGPPRRTAGKRPIG